MFRSGCRSAVAAFRTLAIQSLIATLACTCLALALLTAPAQAQQVVFQGLITTVAGNGTPGSTGDTQAANAAELNTPSAVALDALGNYYIADSQNNRIRKVTLATGVITTVAGGGSGCAGQTDSLGDGCAPSSAMLSAPQGVAVDGAGNLYIADTGNNLIREVTVATGLITSFAGGGSGCLSQSDVEGDGCTGGQAVLNAPAGIAADSAGDIFIADTGNNLVREVNASTNMIGAVAGGGSGACTGSTDAYGDSCTATGAALNTPFGVAVDASGDIFIADTGNNLIREVNASTGLIAAVAGSGTASFSGDTGPAISATLNAPEGVAVDGAGDLYIADTGNLRLRFLKASTGTITTLTGNGGSYSGDNGPPSGAGVDPAGVALDSSNNVYIADGSNQRIREIESAAVNFGAVNIGATSAALPVAFSFTSTTHVGSVAVLTQGTSGKDFQSAAGTTCTATTYGTGSSCTVSVALDPLAPALRTGAVVLYDNSTPANALATVYLSGVGLGPAIAFTPGIINTLAGGGTLSGGMYCVSQTDLLGDGCPATNAVLSNPFSAALDGSRDVYIADNGNNLVREVNAATGMITAVAGNGTAGYTTDGIAATSAELNGPAGMVIDGAGNLYIADGLNNRIRKVDASTGIITTVAGNGTGGLSGDGGPATSAEINEGTGVAVDGAGDLYIADLYNGRIRKVNAATGVITTIAGGGSGCSGQTDNVGDGCPATSAIFYGAFFVTMDAAGDMYVGDVFNQRVRKIDATTGIITTVAGGGTNVGENIAATSAQLNGPWDVAVDGSGNLYLSDYYSQRIRVVNGASGLISTVAGGGSGCSGQTDSLGDGCPATSASISSSYGLAVDSSGNIIIADSNENLIRRVDVSDAPFLAFPATAVGSVSAAQDVSIENLGDALLNISQIATGPDFSLGGADTSCASNGQPLSPAQSCILGNEFAPMFGGSIGENVTLIDNALNVSGASQQIPLSGTATGLGSQTISITTDAPATADYNSQFTVAATASSGLTVTYSPAPGSVCTNVGATFTMTSGTGTCSVLYDQPGNGSYSAAPEITDSVVTNASLAAQATLTVTGMPGSAQVYGATFTVASAGGSGSGAVTFNASGACSNTSGGALISMTSGTGTCSVTATKATDGNYAAATSAAATVNATLGTQATLTVTGMPGSAQVYGATFTVASAGGSGSGAVTFNASGACSNTSGGALISMTSGTGTCSVTATKATDGNYAAATSAAATVNATLGTQATLTVTGMPGSAQVYGATFTVASAGGSGSGAVSFNASGACSNTSGGALISMTSGTGTCSVTATKATDGNYAAATSAAATVNATLGTQATLTVTGMPGSAQVYGATFTVASAGGSGSGAVTFNASGACSNTSGGALISMTSGTGTCSVTATKATDGNYAATTSAAATVNATLGTQATLTVTGMPGSAQVYGATFTVASAGGSGSGAVTFNASGACSNTSGGALISMTSGTGTCSVTATKATDGNYAATTSAAATVNATLGTQATLTVTGMPGSAQVYGATFTVASSGGSGSGAVSFNASGACSNTSGGALISMTSGTGTCSVTATKATDGNYAAATSAAATVNATLGTQATLTVTGMPGSAQVYGATFTVASAGGSGSGAVSFNASGACSNTSGGALISMTSGTGTCSVTATKATDGNYAATTSAAATVNAARASLIVTANNAAAAFGAPIPALTGTLIGVVTGDGITAEYVPNPPSPSSVGEYPIVPMLDDPNNKLANYSVTMTDGELVIYATSLGSTPLALWSSSGSANQGDAGFTLTVTGANFGANAVVLWDGSARQTIAISSTEVQATILTTDLANAGTHLVTVANGAPNPALSAPMAFFVLPSAGNPVAPSITGAAVEASGGGGYTVTLTGENFVSGATVEWNGSGTGVTATYVTPSELTVTVPTGETLPASLTMTDTYGTSAPFTLP